MRADLFFESMLTPINSKMLSWEMPQLSLLIDCLFITGEIHDCNKKVLDERRKQKPDEPKNRRVRVTIFSTIRFKAKGSPQLPAQPLPRRRVRCF